MIFTKKIGWIISFCMTSSTVFAVLPDHEINMQVLKNLSQDPHTFNVNIESITDKGVVHLRGIVPYEDLAKFVSIAQGTVDVQNVDAHQLVSPLGETLDDVALLEAKMQAQAKP